MKGSGKWTTFMERAKSSTTSLYPSRACINSRTVIISTIPGSNIKDNSFKTRDKAEGCLNSSMVNILMEDSRTINFMAWENFTLWTIK